MYTWIHTYIHTYIYVNICIYIFVLIHAFIPVHTYIYKRIHLAICSGRGGACAYLYRNTHLVVLATSCWWATTHNIHIYKQTHTSRCLHRRKVNTNSLSSSMGSTWLTKNKKQSQIGSASPPWPNISSTGASVPMLCCQITVTTNFWICLWGVGACWSRLWRYRNAMVVRQMTNSWCSSRITSNARLWAMIPMDHGPRSVGPASSISGLYTYICVYTYILYIYVYICIYTCIYVYVGLCMYICVYVCIYIYRCVYICMYVYIYMYIYICMYVYTDTYLYMYIHIYICMLYIYMYVYTHMYTHTHTNTHTQVHT